MSAPEPPGLQEVLADVADSVRILDGLAATVDGSVESLLRLMDAVEALSDDDVRHIVWIAAIDRSSAAGALREASQG